MWDRLRYVHGAWRFDSQNWRDATKVALFLNDRLLTRSSVRSSRRSVCIYYIRNAVMCFQALVRAQNGDGLSIQNPSLGILGTAC